MEIKDILSFELFNSFTVADLRFPITFFILSQVLYRILKRLLFRSLLEDAEPKLKKRIHGLLYYFLLFGGQYLAFNILFPNSKGVNLGNPTNLLAALTVMVATYLIIWIITKVIFQKYFVRNNIDPKRQYTITRLVVYVGTVLGIFVFIHALGGDISLLLGGSAALLVGIGLGLQQTFNDLVSGVIILIEGTVSVGDIVYFDGSVAKMMKIGLRTSVVQTRDNSVFIIPNSKLVIDNVHNWSNNQAPVRFQVHVGVAYDSDVRKVEKLLLQAAKQHSKVLEKPQPKVQFADFGDSALNFTLHFFSRENLHVEFVKSDLRFIIWHLLKENNIEIPFPQRDIWFKNQAPNSIRIPSVDIETKDRE